MSEAAIEKQATCSACRQPLIVSGNDDRINAAISAHHAAAHKHIDPLEFRIDLSNGSHSIVEHKLDGTSRIVARL